MALDALLDAVERLPAFQRVVNTLPAPGQQLVAGGLPGSSDAVLVATLARRLPTRFFVVAAETVAESERWLADLETLIADTPIALYPARESFGEGATHIARAAGDNRYFSREWMWCAHFINLLNMMILHVTNRGECCFSFSMYIRCYYSSVKW